MSTKPAERAALLMLKAFARCRSTTQDISKQAATDTLVIPMPSRIVSTWTQVSDREPQRRPSVHNKWARRWQLCSATR
jgi:hypothetical protein